MEQKKRVIFVNTPVFELNDDRLEPPLGILYLATYLQKNGFPCHICDLSGVLEKDWKEYLVSGDVFAFSTYSVTYRRTLNIRDMAKKLNPKALTIAGGPHVTAMPQECQNDFDVIICHEAEIALVELMQAIQKGGDIPKIIAGTPMGNLDKLPFPDYTLVDLTSYTRTVEGAPSISLISSRGCPFKCPYCNSRVFMRGELRFRTAENVVAEMKQLMDIYNTKTFRFSDDLFTFSPKRVSEMCNAIKRLNVRYRVFARSCSITQEAALKLYESGCRHIALGIESMSDRMLQILDKKTTAEINRHALENAKAAGLKVRIYMLVGFPGETEELFEESLKNILACDFDEFIVYPFIPYPGTAVWHDPEKYGATLDRDFSKYVQIGKDRGTCFAVTTKDFTPEDVKRRRQTMIDALEKKVLWAGASQENR